MAEFINRNVYRARIIYIYSVTLEDSQITYTYNRYGELYYKTYENGQKVVYSYDAYGRNNEIRVTQSGQMLSSAKYEYDTMNRLTRVVGHDGTAVVYTYDANGNRETATFANGVVLTYTYDECNRLTMQKVVDKSGKAIAQYNYTLGEGGERTKATEEGPQGTIETAYEYDKAGRLTKETIQKGDEKTTYKYDYDDVGNRIEKRENSNITEYVYNSRNQLIAEETETGVVTYSYDANGNLLNQSGDGKAVTYTYDVYNRLVQYAEGAKKESYTYDAEGVRRSKVNDEETVYFISDTTSSLSFTLVETDEEGNVLASCTRADVLISQNRAEKSSYYLFDGHGDVRGLFDADGNVTDTYRYNAYGELLEQIGDTENHYLYTGEYYDGTSNLYYLRARYMNPSTGTFISMDTYEGSIYDPDTLHKYLYANGNPVKYSDPTGNFSAVTMAAGMAINDCISTAYNIHLMGLIAGLGNMAVNSILGEQGIGLVNSFFEGYQSGIWTAGILYLTAAISVKAFAIVQFGMAAMDVAMSLVLMVAAVNNHNTKEMLVYGALAVMSCISVYQTYRMFGKITIKGDKGSTTIEVGNYKHKQDFDGLNEVKNHLTNDVDGMDYEPNKAMLKKIEELLSDNQELTGAYKDFYEHELTESLLMKEGYDYNEAHNIALEIHNVEPQSLYALEVVEGYYKWFNKNDYEYWGITIEK